MAILQEAGFVTSRKSGKWTYFRLAQSGDESGTAPLLGWVLESLRDDPATQADRERVRQLKKKDSERCS